MRFVFAVFGVTCFVALPVQAQSWQPLFNGRDLQGWSNAKGESAKVGAWRVEGTVLHLDTSQGRGGNLLTEREFGDFELLFEWKIPEGSNNGIKYRVRDYAGRILGCEYQIIDDHNRKLPDKGKTATLYALYETESHDKLNPPQEWNRGRIVVRNNCVEHWLNGRLVMQAKIGSQEWFERVAESKFSDVDGFSLNQRGRIMLTDHKDEVWYRNIFIREFKTCVCPR